jgi:hypothetical protein
VLKGETIASGAEPTCSDCGVTPQLRVCRSAAGYYIGTMCECGPYSRESGYFETAEAAQAALQKGGYERE